MFKSPNAAGRGIGPAARHGPRDDGVAGLPGQGLPFCSKGLLFYGKGLLLYSKGIYFYSKGFLYIVKGSFSIVRDCLL